MRLLHHYTATTFAVLDTGGNPEVQRLWQDNVVRISFQHPFLLRGILAISAAHLAHLNPGNEDIYLLQSSAHIDLALRDLQGQFHDLEDSMVLPLFPFSCLVVIRNFATVKMQDTSDYVEEFLSCVQLVKGVRAVLKVRWDAFLNSELMPLISMGMLPEVETEMAEFSDLEVNAARAMQEAPEVERTACLTAVRHLQSVYRSVQEFRQDKSTVAILLTWPLNVSPDFIDMISKRHPIALIILAHLVVILQSVRNEWWLSGWDAKLLESTIAHLDHEYREWLSWPLSCIRRENVPS